MLSKLLELFSKFQTESVFGFLQGRHTAFAIFFAVTAFWLAAHGKLTDSYAVTITAIQAFVLAHSVKEDYFSKDGK